jgi:hypothetical protein
MGRRRKEETEQQQNSNGYTVTPNDEIAQDSQPEQRASFVERAGAESVKRIGFPVKDGSIDFESMRDKSKKELKEVLKKTLQSEDGAKELGQKTEEKPLILSPETCGKMYDFVGPLVVKGMSKKFDADISMSVFLFSDEEKKALGLPTAKVISKYAPEQVSRYGEEIELAFALVSIVQAKMQLATHLHLLRHSEAYRKEVETRNLSPQSPTQSQTVVN